MQHTIFLLKFNFMRMISNRISVDETKSFSIVILGKIERWKESHAPFLGFGMDLLWYCF